MLFLITPTLFTFHFTFTFDTFSIASVFLCVQEEDVLHYIQFYSALSNYY